MTNSARIVVLAGGSRRSFDLDDLDFSTSQKSLALKIGNRVVSSIFEQIEQEEGA